VAREHPTGWQYRQPLKYTQAKRCVGMQIPDPTRVLTSWMWANSKALFGMANLLSLGLKATNAG
jgi:hypothetical protein